MKFGMDKKVVLVTNGTSYVGAWIVKYLLGDGHQVRITVENKEEVEGYKYLLELAEKSIGSLEAYESNLLQEESFDEAVEGAEIVIHTDYQNFSNFVDAEKEVVQPAVQGVKNIFEAINKSSSVRKVVVTGRMDSVYCDRVEFTEGGNVPFDENCWNTASTLDYQPLSYAKTLSEKTAWDQYECQKEKKYELVVINAGILIGPSITNTPEFPSSVIIRNMLNGALGAGAPEISDAIADVRDVAKAHILAAFNDEAKGRFIVSGGVATFVDMAKIIEGKYPKRFKLPKKNIPKWLVSLSATKAGVSKEYVKRNVGCPIKINNNKSKEVLGLNYTSIEESILDQVEQLQ